MSRDEFRCAATHAVLKRLLALKSLSKHRTLLKLAKQECLQKMLERSRALWQKYILLHTKEYITTELYKKARELVCVLECLCVVWLVGKWGGSSLLIDLGARFLKFSCNLHKYLRRPKCSILENSRYLQIVENSRTHVGLGWSLSAP